jgi:hypothetical protein
VSYLATLLSTAGAELQSTSVTAKEVLFEGLLPDTSYRVSVQPTDSVGNESSDLLTAEYRTVEEIVDEAPVWGDATLSIVALSSTDVEIAWTGASDDNGVIDYLLTLTDLSAPGLPVRLASYPTPTALIDDLSAATDYLIEVQARDVASNVTTDGPSLTFRTEDIPIPADALSLTVDGEIRTASIESFSSQDRGPGAATLSSDGSSVSLEGNIWKRVRIDFDMTADTVLEFDFEGLVEGEVHGIGFGDLNDTGLETSAPIAVREYSGFAYRSVKAFVQDVMTG